MSPSRKCSPFYEIPAVLLEFCVPTLLEGSLCLPYMAMSKRNAICRNTLRVSNVTAPIGLAVRTRLRWSSCDECFESAKYPREPVISAHVRPRSEKSKSDVPL